MGESVTLTVWEAGGVSIPIAAEEGGGEIHETLEHWVCKDYRNPVNRGDLILDNFNPIIENKNS